MYTFNRLTGLCQSVGSVMTGRGLADRGLIIGGDRDSSPHRHVQTGTGNHSAS
jgi:hypothetical protein